MFLLVYLALLALAFFFLIVRPQRQRLAAHRALVASLEVGDEILTSSGIFGRIRTLDVTTAEVEIAPGVVVKVARDAISQRLVEPAPGDADAD
ncbi:MAG: preprotein translocase subunit YajC [Acidimicrobiia bacterium]|nr:preprotein translocase subunit YajC [Acidimicrobiia bacterium]